MKTKCVKVSDKPPTWIQVPVNMPDEVIIQRFRDRMNIVPEIPEPEKRKYKKIQLRKTD